MFYHSVHKQYDDSIHFLNISSLNHSSYPLTSFSINSNLGTYTFNDLEDAFFTAGSYKGPFPLAVRYVKHPYYVIERPPFQIKIDYSPTTSNRLRRPIRPVTIWIPWTVCVINTVNYPDSKIFFNDGPLQSFEDELLLPWTSNIFRDGKICMGSSSPLVFHGQENIDLQTWYSNFMNEYFFGGWNQDISNYSTNVYNIVCPEYFPSNYNSIEIEKLDSSILNKIRSSRMKFYSHRHWSLKQANIYYNLSLLSLDQTLELTKKFKSFNPHNVQTLSSAIKPVANHFSLSNLGSALPFSPYNKFPLVLSIVFNNESSICPSGYSAAYGKEYTNYMEAFYSNYIPNFNKYSNLHRNSVFHNYYTFLHAKKVYDIVEKNSHDWLNQAVEQAKGNVDNYSLQISVSAPITPTHEEIYQLMSQSPILSTNLAKESIQV